MQNNFSLPIIIFLLFTLSGCGFFCKSGNGKITEETRSVSVFTGIRMNGNFDIFISKGAVHALTVEAEENLREFIDIYVQDEKLILKSKECLNPTRDIRINITMPEIREIVINGAGNIMCKDTFNTSELYIKLNGAGNISALINAEKVTTHVNGAGDIRLAGKANELNVKVSGAGDIKAFELPVRRAEIKISGAGDTEVSAAEALDVSILGTGDVFYKGGNPVVKSRITGAGEVVKK